MSDNEFVARIEQYEEIIERHYRARDPESRAEGWMDTAAREIAALCPASVLIPLSDANDLDAVVHALGIEDSNTTPAEAVEELQAEIERLRARIADAADLTALIAERDALRRDNAYMGYVIHGPLQPEQEARATKIERDALRLENERLADVLRWLDKLGGLGYEKHDRIRAALIAKEPSPESAPEPEYTREEMREACRNNFSVGLLSSNADLAAQVAQLRADVAAMGTALADHFDNGIDYSTGANLRAIAERQGGL
jgi:hypothetical protein